MNDPSDCCGLAGFIFGHCFEPRYHEQTADQALSDEAISEIVQNTNDALSSSIISAAKTGTTSSTYVYDVCRRCGSKVIDDQRAA